MTKKNYNYRPLALALSAISISMGFSATASAQLMIEEVVVTAQKREESLQDTPLAISAFSETELQDRGIVGAEDLQFYVPGLTFGKTVTRTAQVTLRGVGAENINPGGDPGVAVHVDGAYQQYTGYIAQDFFDVARVEVLRGPQGTLYGRNATGGSINIITKKPTDEFEGIVKLGVGNYSQVKAQGAISGPIIEDTLLGRLSVDTEDRDGYTDNVLTGDEIDDKDYYSIRGQLEWLASDSLSVNLSAYTYRDDSTGVPLASISPNPSGPLFAGLDITTFQPVFANYYEINNAVPNITIKDRREVRHNTDTEGNEDTDGGTLTITKDFESFSIKSITAYNESDYMNAGDTDSAAEVTFTQSSTGSFETLSQEILLSSTSDGPLEWTAGLYYYDEKSTYDFDIFLFDTIPLNTPFVGVPVSFVAGGEVDAQSMAAFGQATYAFTDALSATIGLRYTSDEKDLDESVEALAFAIVDFETFGPVIVSESDDWSEPTGKIGVEYVTESDTLWYGSISTGFKAGGFNVSGLQSSYDPETVIAYEVGFKSMLADGRVRLNSAAFLYDYEDLQVFQIEGVQASITNAAEAEVYGLEVELLALISEEFEIDGSISYLSAEYEEFFTEDPVEPGKGLQDLSGNSLPRAPEFSLNVGLQYTWTFNNSSSLRARANVSWVDEQYFRAFNLDRDKEDSFTRTDVTMTWTSGDQNWQVDAFVKNIEDEDTVNNIVVSAGTLGSTALASFSPPRTYGASVTRHF
ncbi:MAG: TonB-dependent receptor [Halioglobus sp.]